MHVVTHTISGQEIAVGHGNDPGSGPPVVFVHGILGSVEFWTPALSVPFRESRRWYSVGLPGHWPGRLPADAPFSLDVMGDVLSEALRRTIGDEPAHLVGWSTGGFAALLLAARHPELVRSVLSIDGFATGRWHGLLGAMQKTARAGAIGRGTTGLALRAARSSRTLWNRITKRLMTRERETSHPAQRIAATLLRDVRRHRPAELVRVMAAVREFDIRGELGGITAPTRIAAGENDPCVRPEHTRDLAARIPGADLKLWPGIGHMVFTERLDLFRRTLEDWLERNEPAAVAA